MSACTELTFKIHCKHKMAQQRRDFQARSLIFASSCTPDGNAGPAAGSSGPSRPSVCHLKGPVCRILW